MGRDETNMATSPGGKLETLVAPLARLKGKHMSLVLAVVAVVCTLPSLWVGFAQDDYLFLSIFKGSPGLAGLEELPTNTFSFSEGDLEKNRIRMEIGIIPWWAVEDWKVNLWRPLASLTHFADYKLFGDWPWPMHVHSLLLYALLCVVAGVLYARLIPLRWAAVLAGLLFAVDGGHGLPAGWLSNRNALLSALFGILALLAHDRWRRPRESCHARARLPHAFLACFWLAIALCCGESAVSTGAYLFAYALFLDPLVSSEASRAKPWLARAKAFVLLLPYLGVVIVWRLVYTGLGHGVRGSWLYVDPIADAQAFLMLGLQRFPVLLLGLFGVPDSALWNALPPLGQYVYSACALAALLLMAWVLLPCLRRQPMMSFWAVGAVLSTVPGCATLPLDRLLMFPSIGAMGLVAQFLSHGAGDAESPSSGARPRRRGATVLVYFWVCAHLIIAPLSLLANSYSIKFMDRVFVAANSSVPVAKSDVDTRFVVINTPIDLLGAFLPAYRSGKDLPVPQSWWCLSAGEGPVEVVRIDAYTLMLRPKNGFIQRPWSGIFRRPSVRPMAKGQRVLLSAMEVEVLEVGDDGRPLAARFTFPQPLETSAFKWLTWSDGHYVPFSLPAPGETVLVPGMKPADLLRAALGQSVPKETGVR